MAKDQIRITTYQTYNHTDGTVSTGVKDHYAPAGTVDENYMSMIKRYDELTQFLKSNYTDAKITHMFWKGEGQFVHPSDAVKQQVKDRISTYWD